MKGEAAETLIDLNLGKIVDPEITEGKRKGRTVNSSTQMVKEEMETEIAPAM